MVVDWAATGAMMQGLGAFASAGAIIWAAWKGANTFEQWRKQKVTERKMETAAGILEAALDAQDALSYIRSFMELDKDTAPIRNRLNRNVDFRSKPDEMKKRIITANYILSKINNKRNIQTQLKKYYNISIIVNKELQESLNNILYVFKNVENVLEEYARSSVEISDEKEQKKVKYRLEQIKAIIYYNYVDGKNDTDDMIEKSMKEIRNICMQYFEFGFDPKRTT